MRKVLYSILALVVFQFLMFSLLTRYTPNYRADDIKEKYRDVPNDPNPIFHAIIRLRDSNDRFFCSGFVIDGTFAITAGHCLNWTSKSDKLKIYDRYDNFTGVEASIVGFNDRNDSGIIKGDFRRFQYVKIEKDKHGFIASDGPFMTCGYPYGQKNLYCSYALKVATENFAMRLTGALIPGMSGGPVFDLQTNKVVGINSAVEGNSILVYPLVGILGNYGLEK